MASCAIGNVLMSRRKIGIVGARGVGNYGGFETLVAELAPRLSKQGFSVYCSVERGTETSIVGVPNLQIITFPLSMPANYYLRHLFEFLYDFYFCTYLSFKTRCDVVYLLGTTINILSAIPRTCGAKSIVNMAGVEWKRSKFSSLQRRLLKFSFFLCLLGANVMVIDNPALSEEVPERFQRKTALISYGVDEPAATKWDTRVLPKQKLPLKPTRYWLVIARVQPDNNIDSVIRAYMFCGSVLPLVIVGDYACPPKYKRSIEEAAKSAPDGKTVLLLGGIYDHGILDMLRENAFGYIHPHSIGGTHPSLLEAMITRSTIIANDTPFNREVGRSSILYFKTPDELAEHIDSIEASPEIRQNFASAAYREAKARFSWNDVVDGYVRLFSRLLEVG